MPITTSLASRHSSTFFLLEASGLCKVFASADIVRGAFIGFEQHLAIHGVCCSPRYYCGVSCVTVAFSLVVVPVGVKVRLDMLIPARDHQRQMPLRMAAVRCLL
jgi:hypothetical protein